MELFNGPTDSGEIDNSSIVEEKKSSAFVNPEKLVLTKTRFSDLGLSETLMKGIESAGFIYCTPIQEKCFPFSLKGKDIAGQAQTGTGKTAAL